MSWVIRRLSIDFVGGYAECYKPDRLPFVIGNKTGEIHPWICQDLDFLGDYLLSARRRVAEAEVPSWVGTCPGVEH